MRNYSSIIRRMGHTLLIHFSWRTGLGRFITILQSSVWLLPRFPPMASRAAFSTPTFSVAPNRCQVSVADISYDPFQIIIIIFYH